MALVDCPQCGRKVLSVASTCPHCSYSLVEQRTLEAHRLSGSRCASCGEVIPSGTTKCPHCKASKPARLNLMWVIPLGIIAVAVAAVALTLRQPTARTEPATSPAPAATPTATADAQRDSATEVAPPVQPPVQVEVAPPPVETVTRWTANWANVRQGRSPDSEIVRILTPGLQVDVADLQFGWWAVYIDGDMVGYVARSLIVDQPPDQPSSR